MGGFTLHKKAQITFPQDGNWIGVPVQIPQRRGVALLDFFHYADATWKKRDQELQRIAHVYARYGVQVIAVHTPFFSFEYDIHNVETFFKDYGVSFPIYHDVKRVLVRTLGVHAPYRRFVLNAEGVPIYDFAPQNPKTPAT